MGSSKSFRKSRVLVGYDINFPLLVTFLSTQKVPPDVGLRTDWKLFPKIQGAWY